MNIRVTVTQKNIDEGRPGNSQDCPLALALSEKFPDVRCSARSTWAEIGGTIYEYSMRATGFVIDVDRRIIDVAPATFVLTEEGS